MDIKKQLDNFKSTQKSIIEAQIETIFRPDYWFEIDAAYKTYFGERANWEYINGVVRGEIVPMLNTVVLRVDALTVDDVDVPVDEFKDPFEDLIAYVDQCDSIQEAWCEFVKFNYLRPYAQQVLNFNRMINEEKTEEENGADD